MRNFPTTFTNELKRPGCTPYWLLKITTTADTYYISDNNRQLPVSGEPPSVMQVYGAAKSFGALKEGISGALGEFSVAEYTIDLLLGVPISNGGMLVETLADAGLLDDAQADLYLGLAGISDPPQLITPGRIRDYGERTDTVLPVMIQDKTIDLERVFVGTKLSNTTYPNALAADIGKMIPIPFGPVAKIPALCVHATDPYMYIFSDRPVTSIPAVWARNSGKADINISAYCTAYTGQPSQQYGGMSQGIIIITAAQAAQIQALLNIALTDPGHPHNVTNTTITQQATNAPAANWTILGGQNSGWRETLMLFSAPSGSRVSVTYRLHINQFQLTDGIQIWLVDNNNVRQVMIYQGYPSSPDTPFLYNWSTSDPALAAYDRITIVGGYTNVTGKFGLQTDTAEREISTITESATVVTGASITQPPLVNAVSEQILVDAVANRGTFETACNWVLALYGFSAIQIIGTLPVTNCAGLIDDYKTALYWLNYWAFQAGAWFMMPTGQAKLVSRQLGAAVRTISTCNTEGGRRSLTQTRTDLVDVIDKVVVLYNRDWTKGKGSDAYNGATGVGGTGSRERPDLFQFDFIMPAVDADTLRLLYLSYCRNRHRGIRFDNPIEQADIESGDTVTLSFLGGITGVVIPSEHAPGDMDKADNIKLTVLV